MSTTHVSKSSTNTFQPAPRLNHAEQQRRIDEMYMALDGLEGSDLADAARHARKVENDILAQLEQQDALDALAPAMFAFCQRLNSFQGDARWSTNATPQDRHQEQTGLDNMLFDIIARAQEAGL